VEFPNQDPFFHNVFFVVRRKRFRSWPLRKWGTTRFVQFDKPGISFSLQHFHAQMSAVVIALNTPYLRYPTRTATSAGTTFVPGRLPRCTSSTRQSLRMHCTPAEHEITVGRTSRSQLANDLELAHKNKYGRGYDRPDPDSPAVRTARRRRTRIAISENEKGCRFSTPRLRSICYTLSLP